MKKKILVIVASLLVLSMTLTPFAFAKPWNTRNNDKFQTFDVEATFDLTDVMFGVHQYVPSFGNPKKLIITWEEDMDTYELKVGDNYYYLSSDFDYSGTGSWIFYDPVFDEADVGKVFPISWSAVHAIIDYMYDFSDGIDGTIQMRYVVNKGAQNINSLAGTGDLQNVQIKATAWNSIDAGIVTIFHEGIVSGWPE